MRRTTTISRSSSLAAVSLALGLTAVPLVRPAAGQEVQRPQTITVVRGNTLWDLAAQYLGDPLLWPAIYRLNTDVIEDPHWIYPGEVLRLGPSGEVLAVEAADTVMAGDTVLVDTAVLAPPPGEPILGAFARPGLREARHTLRGLAELPYRPLRRGEFYSAGFLTEGDRLPFGRVIGNIEPPAIRSLSGRSTATEFERIAVRPPGGASYQVGDSLWLVRVAGEVRGYGNVVKPAGIARVIGGEGDETIAEVVDNFTRIPNGISTLPLDPFRDPGEVRPLPVEDGITARVLASRDAHELVTPQAVLFLDRGRADGLALGDIFSVVRPVIGTDTTYAGPGEEMTAVVMVVYLREHTASTVALTVAHPDIRAGALARLIRKMPG